MKQQPDNVLDARQEMRRRRRRRLRIQRISILLAVFLLVALFVTLAVLYIIGNQAAKRGETTTFLGVKAIQVGNVTVINVIFLKVLVIFKKLAVATLFVYADKVLLFVDFLCELIANFQNLRCL